MVIVGHMSSKSTFGAKNTGQKFLTWYRGSGHMPEELCQVYCKSHYGSLALHSDPSPLVIFLTLGAISKLIHKLIHKTRFLQNL